MGISSRYRVPAVEAGQIELFPAKLFGGQAEDVTGRCRVHRSNCPHEADESILEHVVGLFPAAVAGEAGQHALGYLMEAVGDRARQLLTGAGVAAPDVFEPGTQQRGLNGRLGHCGRVPKAPGQLHFEPPAADA
jgi:hypothetical protein